MNATALKKKVVVDESGNPVEVIIPYEQYIEFVETYGLDLSDEERDAILAAKADFVGGNVEEFVSAEEVKREIGCTE